MPDPAKKRTVAEAFASVASWQKMESYFEVYDRYFAPLRGKPVKMLEIGIDRGGSIAGWKKYFGEAELDYTGLDINPDCSRLARAGVKIVIGDQMNASLLAEIARAGPYDIIIDDGGHVTGQQIVSFEHLFGAVGDGGYYVIEDTHTSFWPSFHSTFTIGSTTVRGGFLDYAPLLIRSQMEFWWSPESFNRAALPRESRPPANLGMHAKKVFAISFYDSLVVIEKRAQPEPLNIVC
jgi:hypothetical protein